MWSVWSSPVHNAWQVEQFGLRCQAKRWYSCVYLWRWSVQRYFVLTRVFICSIYRVWYWIAVTFWKRDSAAKVRCIYLQICCSRSNLIFVSVEMCSNQNSFSLQTKMRSGHDHCVTLKSCKYSNTWYQTERRTCSVRFSTTRYIQNQFTMIL